MASKISLGALEVSSSALFLCDVQEKFRPAMEMMDDILENITKLIEGCKILRVPLLVTEQYPSGLGSTISSLQIDHAQCVVPKTKFSMIVPEIEEKMQPDLKSIILCGIETHVCVEQTAIDLISKGFVVHIVADCCTSRTQEDRLLALQRLQKIGCFITTTESVLFKLLGDKEHPDFKSVAGLVRSKSKSTGLVARM